MASGRSRGTRVTGGSDAEAGAGELRGTRGSASRKPRWRRAGLVGPGWPEGRKPSWGWTSFVAPGDRRVGSRGGVGPASWERGQSGRFLGGGSDDHRRIRS